MYGLPCENVSDDVCLVISSKTNVCICMGAAFGYPNTLAPPLHTHRSPTHPEPPKHPSLCTATGSRRRTCRLVTNDPTAPRSRGVAARRAQRSHPRTRSWPDPTSATTLRHRPWMNPISTTTSCLRLYRALCRITGRAAAHGKRHHRGEGRRRCEGGHRGEGRHRRETYPRWVAQARCQPRWNPGRM